MARERGRERESECERGLKYLWSTTSQGSAGLQHCPPGEQVDSVSVPAGPSWQPPDGSLVSITWMCTHTLTHSIYILYISCSLSLFYGNAVLPSAGMSSADRLLQMLFDFYCVCHIVMLISTRTSAQNGQRRKRQQPYLTWFSCTLQDGWCQR